MRDFDLDEIVDEVVAHYGLSSRAAVRRILLDHLRKIIRIMGSKRDRILLRRCDLHTIYTNPDIHEMMGKVADLDETRVEPAFERGFAIANEKWRNPRKAQKIASWRARKAVDFLPELNA